MVYNILWHDFISIFELELVELENLTWSLYWRIHCLSIYRHGTSLATYIK